MIRRGWEEKFAIKHGVSTTMSVLVQGLCYKISFGCPKRKAIAVALADHAHDDGSSVWPSVQHVAEKVEWSKRTVQRALRELEEMGLLVVVSEGGKGAKDTREYKFDMEILRGLSDGYLQVEEYMGDGLTSSKDDRPSPLVEVRVSAVPGRVSSTTNKGVQQTPEPSLNINNHQRADMRASEGPRAPSAANKRGLTQHEVTRRDPQWDGWMKHLLSKDRRDLIDAAEHHGAITVFGSLWPDTLSMTPRVDPLPTLTDRSKQMAGEAEK